MLLILLVVSVQGAWGATEGEWNHFAAEKYASGAGTKENPWVIKTPQQLAYMSQQISLGQGLDAYYVLGADIDLDAHYWTPIGSLLYNASAAFRGSFDGKGHIIRNMHINWYSNSTDKLGFGFFSNIGSGTSGRWSEVKNIIFDNADVSNDNTSKLPNSRYLGVLAGAIKSYSKVQNIIIRNSKINGPSSSFGQNGKYFIVGGCAGKLEDNNNNYKISNIAVDVDIYLEKLNANRQDLVWIGGFIGECKDNVTTAVNNVYSLGTIKMPENCSKVGSVFAVQYSKLITTTLYYANPAKVNLGTQKSPSSFTTTFIKASNDYIASNNGENLSAWYSDNVNTFRFEKFDIDLSVDYKSNVLISATLQGASSNASYNWYVSDDNKTWKKSTLSNTKTFTLPYEGRVKYVYAETADKVARSASVEISTIIKANAYLENTSGTYGVKVTNSRWEDNKYLTVSYQWMADGADVPEANESTYTPSGAYAGKKVSCHVTLSNGDYSILDKTLYMATVVFLKPDGGDNRNSGMDDQHPVKTWQKAYSLLNVEGSWDENTIVLMGSEQ